MFVLQRRWLITSGRRAGKRLFVNSSGRKCLLLHSLGVPRTRAAIARFSGLPDKNVAARILPLWKPITFTAGVCLVSAAASEKFGGSSELSPRRWRFGEYRPIQYVANE